MSSFCFLNITQFLIRIAGGCKVAPNATERWEDSALV